MDYYSELIEKIENNINEGCTDEARILIEDELKQAYVPKDILNKLNYYLDKIGPKEKAIKQYSDDDIVELLNGSKEKQLIGVDCLNSRNLRNYIDICNKYLNSDGFINAKVLLVDSLIRQEIGETITFDNNGVFYEFIPKYVLPIEESDGFNSGIKYLEDRYMKEPSKLKMAKDLLYKELIMLLPINQEESEGISLAKNIIEYIEKAFVS